jgi:bacteriocin-like protein
LKGVAVCNDAGRQPSGENTVSDKSETTSNTPAEKTKEELKQEELNQEELNQEELNNVSGGIGELREPPLVERR